MYDAAPLPAMSRVKLMLLNGQLFVVASSRWRRISAPIFMRVRSAQYAEVLHNLIRSAVVKVRRCLAVTHAQETFDVQDGKSLFIRPQLAAVGTANFEAHDAELLDSKVGVLPDAELLDVALVPAEAQFVHQRWAEGVHVLRGQALIGKCGVVEEVRIQLRVGEVPCRIDVMDEDLVARTETVVNARDALIDIYDIGSHPRKVDCPCDVRQRHVLVDQDRPTRDSGGWPGSYCLGMESRTADR